MTVSKPNKKVRSVPPMLSKKTGGAFEIFKDENISDTKEETFVIPRAGTSTSAPVNRAVRALVHEQTMRSPVASIQASDRRAKELTESPLADVTLAYTGNGRFTNSPTVSFTSDLNTRNRCGSLG